MLFETCGVNLKNDSIFSDTTWDASIGKQRD